MRFLICGCCGMAGHMISLYLKEQGHYVFGFDRRKSDLIDSVAGDACDKEFVKNLILSGNYDTVINCIGILNQAAEDNKALATYLNSYFPHFLAEVTKDTNIQVIHTGIYWNHQQNGLEEIGCVIFMKEIDKNLYLIEKNNNLYQKALAIVNRPLSNNYKDLYDDFRDTAEILNQIIDDRSDQIDEGVKKSLNNNSAFYIESKQVCKCFLRVSSKKQSDDLERQINNLTNICKDKYSSFEIITDIGSGINYNKPGLKKLIEKINKKEVDVIVVLYKDRLLRFGFELVEYFAALNNVKIEVLDKKDKTEESELVEDLVQFITVFSCRLQGKRKSKTKKIVDDFLKEIETIEVEN